MFSSFAFLPLVSLSFLNKPFSDGPIFRSSESVLWHTPHCSNTSLPLAASPALLAENDAEASSSAPSEPVHRIQFRMPECSSIVSGRIGASPRLSPPPLVYNLRGSPSHRSRPSH